MPVRYSFRNYHKTSPRAHLDGDKSRTALERHTRILRTRLHPPGCRRRTSRSRRKPAHSLDRRGFSPGRWLHSERKLPGRDLSEAAWHTGDRSVPRGTRRPNTSDKSGLLAEDV